MLYTTTVIPSVVLLLYTNIAGTSTTTPTTTDSTPPLCARSEITYEGFCRDRIWFQQPESLVCCSLAFILWQGQKVSDYDKGERASNFGEGISTDSMSLIKKSTQTCRAVTRALGRMLKFLVRLLTRKSELERLIRKAIAEESRGHSAHHLVKNIARSLATSSQLAEIKAIVFGKQPFVVEELATQIANEKHIHNDDVISRLTWCLKVLSTTNIVHQRVGELQRTSYDPANPEHVAQLELLWESLRPESRREDWGELGFQNGKVPQSDFRGMGMLGLHQLVYFAEHRTREAQVILNESTNPKRYFPFAAAGINITAFTVTMLEQRRLESCIYDALVKRMPSGCQGDSWPNEETLVSAGVAAFNDFYGEEYVKFSRFWHESLPESTMAFPGIFRTIKQRSNSKFPPLLVDEE